MIVYSVLRHYFMGETINNGTRKPNVWWACKPCTCILSFLLGYFSKCCYLMTGCWLACTAKHQVHRVRPIKSHPLRVWHSFHVISLLKSHSFLTADLQYQILWYVDLKYVCTYVCMHDHHELCKISLISVKQTWQPLQSWCITLKTKESWWVSVVFAQVVAWWLLLDYI